MRRDMNEQWTLRAGKLMFCRVLLDVEFGVREMLADLLGLDQRTWKRCTASVIVRRSNDEWLRPCTILRSRGGTHTISSAADVRHERVFNKILPGWVHKCCKWHEMQGGVRREQEVLLRTHEAANRSQKKLIEKTQVRAELGLGMGQRHPRSRHCG